MDDSVTLFNGYSISPHTAMAHVFEMVDDGGEMLFQALTLKSPTFLSILINFKISNKYF